MRARTQAGFSMIEVLITIAILMVGLLGLAGLQTRVATAEFEGYQRSQALVILQDMVDRINANKKDIAMYVASDIGAGGSQMDCTLQPLGALRDRCDFNNELVGVSEKSATSANVGAMVNGLACITRSPEANVYIVTVAWQGVTPTAVPTSTCGTGLYGDERLRRTVSMPVRVATLTAP